MTHHHKRELIDTAVLAAITAVVLWLAFSIGCSSREVSSTDHHNRVPALNCTDVMYQHQYHHMCCEGSTCVLTD